MPGSRIRWVYSARPVTLSRASNRGTERPICPPPNLFIDIGSQLLLRARNDGSLQFRGIVSSRQSKVEDYAITGDCEMARLVAGNGSADRRRRPCRGGLRRAAPIAGSPSPL
jgi:hypothetical protein